MYSWIHSIRLGPGRPVYLSAIVCSPYCRDYGPCPYCMVQNLVVEKQCSCAVLSLLMLPHLHVMYGAVVVAKLIKRLDIG